MAAVQPRKPTKDAEAIAIAARQPEMRFVSPKSEEQQARAALFGGRERLVRQRRELMNALRANFYEYGVLFPIGMNQTQKMASWLTEHGDYLPKIMADECIDILALIGELSSRIAGKQNCWPRWRQKIIRASPLANHAGCGLDDCTRG